MKRSSKSRELTMEVTVGVFMFAAILSLCFFTILLSRENIFRTTYPLEVVFEEVMGLRDGDNVVVRGVPVGKVKSLKLQRDGVHVTASLKEQLVLKQDYKVEIVTTSVLGGRYMEVSEGSAKAKSIEPGVVIKGVTPRDLMAEATKVVANLKDVSDRIASGQGTLGKLINDDTLYADAQEIMNEIKSAVKDQHILQNLDVSVANLKEISTKINEGQGTLGKLVNDDTLYADAREIMSDIKTVVKEGDLLKNIETSAANLKDISTKINEGQGTLGKLVNDDSLYEETKKIMGDARATLEDLRETAPITAFTSIFFGAF